MIKQIFWGHFAILRRISLVVLAGSVVCSTTVFTQGSRAIAQTDFNILAESENLKAEFQKELDKWMLRAYQGDRDAQFKVAVLFANDQFGSPDHEQAAYWYNQAARQGHVLAQYNLGHQYLTGSGVKRDEKTAMQWWLKAAEQQHALAQFNVGRAYYLGIGLEKDLSQAKLWFERASQNNEPKSTEILKQLGWWNSSSVASVSQPLTNTAEVSLPADDNNLLTNTAVSSSSLSSSGSPTDIGKPIAVFTNPAVREVLISIFDDALLLNTVSGNDSWTIVTSNQGFPVWVNKNFINIEGTTGTITANSVNARSVPLITTGSVVGRLNKGETATVLDQRGDWYRIQSPARFRGWVRTDDLNIAQAAPSAPPPIIEDKESTPLETVDLQNAITNFDNNAWLFKQNEDHYALQLASFSDPRSTQRFIEGLPFKESDNLHLFTTKTNDGIDWTYIIYGNFDNKDTAQAMADELKQKRAWIRRFGVLQQNRCIAWKKELPAPKELNEFCI